MSGSYLYRDKPVFGIDIGHANAKFMQLNAGDTKDMKVVGYGVAEFDAKCIKNGEIVDPVSVAKAIRNSFDKKLVGKIDTRRVVATIPSARTFQRAITLPNLSTKELRPAVELESEQYIPVPINDLYIDFEITKATKENIELLAMAAPKRIIDSYMTLLQLLGLEVCLLEPTISSAARLFSVTSTNDLPSILIDFGSHSTDLTVYDHGLVVSGTVPQGGEQFTQAIADKLKVSVQEAHTIKTRYGLGPSKKQSLIVSALEPALDGIVREARKMLRYYTERAGQEKKIAQVLTMGGGSNMPGLDEFLTAKLGIPARAFDVWEHVSFDKLQPPHEIERSMYITVAGIAMVNPREIFK